MTREEILAVRQEQIAALEASMQTATPWPGPGPKPATYMDAADIQARIDKLKAQWAKEDAEYVPPGEVGPAGPAASDAWTQVPVGTIIQEDGKSYEVRDTPFGHMKFLIRATPAAPSVATERASYVEFIKGRLALTADLEAQAELVALLGWLSKR